MRILMMALTTAMMSLTVAGCSSPRMASEETVPWRAVDELGRVALFIELDRVGPERTRPVKHEEVEKTLRLTFGARPQTCVLDAAALFDSISEEQEWSSRTEYELIQAARQQGIDTIGQIRVNRYLGYSGIALLPPGWWAETVVDYRLRLLDVASGTVVADVRRTRRRGGYWGGTSRAHLRLDLQDDLSDLLATAGTTQ